MEYISTRGNAPTLNFEEACLTAIAQDGGLYVPKTFPEFSLETIKSWVGLPYTDIAFNVMWPYVEGSFSEADFRAIIKKSYSTFRSPEVTPLHKLDDNHYVLELFHGPTLAFKDVALQFLGNLLDFILDKQKRDIVIIGATSGDTGSAAIEGCRSCKHIQLFMLHPKGKVSDVQRKQMTTILSDNIFNLAIDGNFDDCQTMVKDLFATPDFTHGKPLSAVNSINWARIMAQITYYFYTVTRLEKFDGKLNFSVPTGNFGDIFAGYIAQKMGLPMNKLIVATNANDILHRFFADNDYSQNGVRATVSPSMDIQISSNFERLLFDLYNQDGAAIAELMAQLKKDGHFKVTDSVLAKARKFFDSSTLDDEGIVRVIKDIHTRYDYLIDPHTATAIESAEHHTGCINIVLATAHPAKFPDVIIKATSIHPELPEHLHDLHDREEYMTSLALDESDIKNFIRLKA